MKIFTTLIILFFCTSAFSAERLLCEVDKQSWTYFKFLVSDFLDSEKFNQDKKNEFEKLKYSFERIFWQDDRDFEKTISSSDLEIEDKAAYFEINKNIFGQYKSLTVEFNDEPIPLIEETNGSLLFRAWPHRTNYGESDIHVSINRLNANITVYSERFNEFFDQEFFGLGLDWNCRIKNNKF